MFAVLDMLARQLAMALAASVVQKAATISQVFLVRQLLSATLQVASVRLGLIMLLLILGSVRNALQGL